MDVQRNDIPRHLTGRILNAVKAFGQVWYKKVRKGQIQCLRKFSLHASMKRIVKKLLFFDFSLWKLELILKEQQINQFGSGLCLRAQILPCCRGRAASGLVGLVTQEQGVFQLPNKDSQPSCYLKVLGEGFLPMGYPQDSPCWWRQASTLQSLWGLQCP